MNICRLFLSQRQINPSKTSFPIVTDEYKDLWWQYHHFWRTTACLNTDFFVRYERFVIDVVRADLYCRKVYGRFYDTNVESFASFMGCLNSVFIWTLVAVNFCGFLCSNCMNCQMHFKYKFGNFIFQPKCTISSVRNLIYPDARTDLNFVQ